ncbi:MAG: alkaline phosphatase family protein, partial [bacterium]
MGEITTANWTARLWGAACGGIAGLSVAAAIAVKNPVFFDHLGWTLLSVWFIPVIVGFLVGSVWSLVRQRPIREQSSSASRKAVLAGSHILLLIACLSLWLWSRANATRPLGPSWPDLLIVGLDGATWDIMDPMMESGELPHLAELCKTGALGPLESLSPIRSPLIWTSIATGRYPEDHGITGYYETRSDLTSSRLWDVAHARGKRVGLFRWLITWPPDRQFEFTIPSWLARSPKTWPAQYQFIQELDLNQNEIGDPASVTEILHGGIFHGFRIKTAADLAFDFIRSPSDTDESFVRQHMRSVEPSIDVYLHLLRRFHPQVTAVCLYGMDQLAHRFWNCFAPEGFDSVDETRQRLYSDVIPAYYRLADRALGRVLAVLPQETTVIVLSDHGMGPDP